MIQKTVRIRAVPVKQLILPVRFLKGRIFLQWHGSAQGSLVQRELSAKLTEGLLPQYDFAEAFL